MINIYNCSNKSVSINGNTLLANHSMIIQDSEVTKHILNLHKNGFIIMNEIIENTPQYTESRRSRKRDRQIIDEPIISNTEEIKEDINKEESE